MLRHLRRRRNVALFAIIWLALAGTVWAEQHPCAVCSTEQSRIHLEDCPLSSEWEGQTYHFCQQGCQKTFLAEPKKWATAFTELRKKKPADGTRLPAFSFPLEPAGTLENKDVVGRVLVLNCWAEWCAPCMKEMPDLVKLQEELGERGLLVVGLSFDKSRKTHRETARKLGLNFPSIYADQPPVQDFLTELGPIEAIPVTFVVDREGNLVKRIEGATSFEELRKLVTPLLESSKEEAPPPEESRGSVVPS